jgi:hypothetical protein
MEGMGIGGGLGALAFWGFVAVCVVAGIWDGARRREARHETLRRLIDSGQPLDPALADRVLGADRPMDRDLKVGGIVLLCAAPGLAAMGWLIGLGAPAALYPLLGVAALVLCVAVGLLAASKVVGRSRD